MTSTGLLILASGFLLMTVASVPEVRRRVRGMFYGWFMAGLGGLIMILGTVPLWSALPVWNPVLRNAFGWSAGQMSWAFSITQVEGGFLGPVEGVLIDKLGSRRMVFIGLTIAGVGFIFFSQIRELWHLYAAFVLMSMGGSMGGWLPMMTVMNHWFVRHRSVAMSLVLEGFALGGIVVPPLLAWAIGGADPNISERFGWRTCALFVGILCIVSAFPVSRLVRNRPEEMGLKPDGDSPVSATASPVNRGVRPLEIEEEGYTWQEAIRTSTFWLISFGHAFGTIVWVTIAVHMGLMLDDRGFSLQTISVVVAVYTAVSAIFMPVGGYLGDRFPMKLVAFWFSALQSLSVVLLLLAHDKGTLFLFAVLWGAGFGGRTPVTTAMRGLYFGRRAFAAIVGISIVPMNLLLFVAPPFAGYMRDATGNYNISFLIVAAVSMLGSCLFLLLGEPGKLPVRGARSPRAAG